jgi:hypothetical protein
VVVLAAQQDRVARRGAVEVAAVQPATPQRCSAKPAPRIQEPSGSRRGGGHARQPLLHRRGVLQRHLVELEAVLGQVEVGVVEAGQGDAPRGAR